MAVGSRSPNNVKAEVYEFGTGDWTIVQDYPYGAEYVAYYDMVYIPATSAYYVIGGYNGEFLSTIGMFKNGAWTEVGQLNTARSVSFSLFFVFQSYRFNFKRHRAEWANGALIVAGGWDIKSSEKCTISESGMFTCVDITSTLYNYASGVSFVVESTYCV